MQAATPLPCSGVPGVASLTLRLLLHALPVASCSAFRAKEAFGNPSLDQRQDYAMKALLCLQQKLPAQHNSLPAPM